MSPNARIASAADRALVTVPVLGVRVVLVVVRDRLVKVLVFVALGEVQPDPDGHERGGDHQDERHRRPENDGEHRPEERRDREVGAGPGAAHVPHRDDEEHQAHAVVEESNHRRGSTS